MLACHMEIIISVIFYKIQFHASLPTKIPWFDLCFLPRAFRMPAWHSSSQIFLVFQKKTKNDRSAEILCSACAHTDFIKKYCGHAAFLLRSFVPNPLEGIVRRIFPTRIRNISSKILVSPSSIATNSISNSEAKILLEQHEWLFCLLRLFKHYTRIRNVELFFLGTHFECVS